ncbi:MAG: DNA repair protein RecN [Oscillospiraceae bacterium]|nr:DNA repair protein RecN [Oscillospiraceae bacterium]
MLKELYIENLAVIEKAVISFDGGFTAFTGETGAGKSILIGGINAVLGERVSKDIVRAGAEKAVIVALFSLPDNSELSLTREISATGNSVARINGRTATAAELKEAASGLIDIHGQHQTRLLISPETQLALVDSFGKIDGGSLKADYEAAFREFSQISKQLKAAQSADALREDKIVLLSGKIADVAPFKLKAGEEAQVSEQLARLRNAQHIADAVGKAYSALASDGDVAEYGAVDLLNICKVALTEAGRYIPACAELTERIVALVIEADDIKSELSGLVPRSEELEQLPALEERMSDFLRLKRKYNLEPDELAAQLANWQRELGDLQNSDVLLHELAEQKRVLGERVRDLGATLSAARKAAAQELSQRIASELDDLAMAGTQLLFDIRADKVTISGMDSVELLICANKGETPKPLSKVASGGELSRIMLAIKSVQATTDDVPTVIFDEIDAGISGRAAHKVAVKLAALSRERQVLCVTHLAQIAAMADNHLLIEKAVADGRTFTQVAPLDEVARKRELARIISGFEGFEEDEVSLATAQKLLERRAGL